MDGELDSLIKSLNNFDWDSDKGLITLNPSDIITILEKYINKEISSELIDKWANAIENREDIDFEPSYEDSIDSIIFELANPLLTEELSINRAKILINKLAPPL